MKFVEKYIDIPTGDKAIIKYTRKPLMFNKEERGLLPTPKIIWKIRKNLALYRDDGLAIFKNASLIKIKKHFCELSREHNLKPTIQYNRKVENFPDATLNMENSLYRSYVKDNCKIIRVNTEPNHPPSIIKKLPK